MNIPPFNVSADAINRIDDISALLKRHNIVVEGEHNLRLRKANRIKTIHSSLAIEGNTLSEEAVKSLNSYILSPPETGVRDGYGDYP